MGTEGLKWGGGSAQWDGVLEPLEGAWWLPGCRVDVEGTEDASGQDSLKE